ncbi:MAG: hypothetical protein ACKVT1_02765 [Dehalococcoidia bacterium]
MNRPLTARLALTATAATLLVAVAFVLALVVDYGPFGRTPSDDSRAWEPVSEAEARAALAGLGQAAADGEFDQVCFQPGPAPRCEPDAASPGKNTVSAQLRRAAPATAPSVTGVVICLADAKHAPSVKLALEGVDAEGQAYRSDFLVSRRPDGRLDVMQPVFWYPNFGIDTSSQDCTRVDTGRRS